MGQKNTFILVFLWDTSSDCGKISKNGIPTKHKRDIIEESNIERFRTRLWK
jgi:hypothetical protein